MDLNVCVRTYVRVKRAGLRGDDENTYLYKGRGIGQITSARVVSCRVMLSVLLFVVWHIDDFPPSPLPASPKSTPSLTLESHLWSRQLYYYRPWLARACNIPLSTDQVAAWTWVTAARLVRTLGSTV
jgi:hypothetical protein